MKKIRTDNPQNPHYCEVKESMYDALIENFGTEKQLYYVIREYAPDGRSIPNARHMAAMMENQCKFLNRNNPAAWRIRELSPDVNSYERGLFRHPGHWNWVKICPGRSDSGERPPIMGWINENGESPSYENAESYEAAMA